MMIPFKILLKAIEIYQNPISFSYSIPKYSLPHQNDALKIEFL